MRHFEKNKRTIRTGNHSDEISEELFQTKPTELYYLYYLKYIKNGYAFWPGWTERRVLIDRGDFNPKNFQKSLKNK